MSDTDLWFEDSGGGGTPVVLLHAGSGASVMWKHQRGAFVQAGWRTIAYDRPGHGRARAIVDARPAADVLASLLDRLDVPRAHLVGTAAGAIVAMDFALSFPARSASVVLANTHGGFADDDYVALQKRLRPAPAFEALPAHVRELGPAYRAAQPEGEAEWRRLAHEAIGDGPMPKVITRSQLTLQGLSSLKLPVLLLTGDADLYMPTPVLGLFAARLAHAQRVVLRECGHSAYWEQPQRFNEAVLAFLAAHAR